jgi:serine/threonine-protein kinase
MYEMLTGQLPFSASSATELARQHREDEPTPPRQHNPRVPPALDQISMKVLSKEPAARYRTADQLGRVLTNVLHHADTTAVANPAPPAPTVETRPETRPVAVPRRPPAAPVAVAPPNPEENPLDIDWITIGLGLLALLAVGGLVPFFLWVYFRINGITP